MSALPNSGQIRTVLILSPTYYVSGGNLIVYLTANFFGSLA